MRKIKERKYEEPPRLVDRKLTFLEMIILITFSVVNSNFQNDHLFYYDLEPYSNNE